jgi:hypothetical protein
MARFTRHARRGSWFGFNGTLIVKAKHSRVFSTRVCRRTTTITACIFNVTGCIGTVGECPFGATSIRVAVLGRAGTGLTVGSALAITIVVKYILRTTILMWTLTLRVLMAGIVDVGVVWVT